MALESEFVFCVRANWSPPSVESILSWAAAESRMNQNLEEGRGGGEEETGLLILLERGMGSIAYHIVTI